MKALMTGSRVYGLPDEGSDIDLVVLATADEVQAFADAATADGVGGSGSEVTGSNSTLFHVSLRFGRINLILVDTEEKFAIWQNGTRRLEYMKPVTREQAVAMFTSLQPENRK